MKPMIFAGKMAGKRRRLLKNDAKSERRFAAQPYRKIDVPLSLIETDSISLIGPTFSSGVPVMLLSRARRLLERSGHTKGGRTL